MSFSGTGRSKGRPYRRHDPSLRVGRCRFTLVLRKGVRLLHQPSGLYGQGEDVRSTYKIPNLFVTLHFTTFSAAIVNLASGNGNIAITRKC